MINLIELERILGEAIEKETYWSLWWFLFKLRFWEYFAEIREEWDYQKQTYIRKCKEGIIE